MPQPLPSPGEAAGGAEPAPGGVRGPLVRARGLPLSSRPEVPVMKGCRLHLAARLGAGGETKGDLPRCPLRAASGPQGSSSIFFRRR